MQDVKKELPTIAPSDPHPVNPVFAYFFDRMNRMGRMKPWISPCAGFPILDIR